MKKKESVNQSIALIDENLLKSKIYTIRGIKVMLDADLAEIYGYETKRFSEQIKNNESRFAEDFRFLLSKDEFENLKPKKSASSWGGARKPHYAFTEQGIYMLMTVLKGDVAVQQSIALIRLFKQMKDYIIAENQSLPQCANCVQIATLTARHSQEIAEIKSDVSALKDMSKQQSIALAKVMGNFTDPSTFKHFLFLNGQKFEADVAYTQIYSLAKNSIIVIDNYVSAKTLNLLRGIAENVKVTILSDQYAGCALTPDIITDFNAARTDIQLTRKPAGNRFHDRYVVIDFGTQNEKMFHCGASSKDTGSKITTITQLEDIEMYRAIIQELIS